jgi:hypothetical protein
MYVAISGYGKARVIQFREDTRIPGTKKKKTHVVRTIGNYERLLAEDPDILRKLKLQAAKETSEKKAMNQPIMLQLSTETIHAPGDVTASYRFGHAVVKQLWQRVGLDELFCQESGKRNAEAVAQAIYYLAAHRLCDPASILASAQEQSRYAGLQSLGLDVFYQVLDTLAVHKEAVVARLCAFFERHTSRQGPAAYYDVTTYAFESTRWGELRMFGFSKDHKNNEVQVVMGLLLDNNGIPITYELFPGNTMDQCTLTQAVARLKERYRLEKIVVVADRGLNGHDNLAFLTEQGHDFVIGYTLKRAAQQLQALALDDSGWTSVHAKTGELTSKSKVLADVLRVKVPVASPPSDEKRRPGRPKKYDTLEIPVKIHLSWTAKRAAKDRADRERMLERLRKRLDKPYQLKADIKRGRNQYLALEIDTENCQLDQAKIAQAERFDGYYAVITNNLTYDTEQVAGIYGGLWQIEESFRILKTDLRARPVFVWTDAHIQGHFVLCFLCLCLIRYAQYFLLEKKQTWASAREIMEAIDSPLALVQGVYPRSVVTPTCLTQTYLDLAELLSLPPLKTNMTLTGFRAATKLDLSANLK